MNLPEWDGHHWERPTSPPCPHCPCCRAHACQEGTWLRHFWPHPDKPCPCQSKAAEWSVVTLGSFLIPVDPETMEPLTRERAVEIAEKFNRGAIEAGESTDVRAIVQHYGEPVEMPSADEAAAGQDAPADGDKL